MERPLPSDPEFFLKLVVPLVRNAFTSPQDYRHNYLRQCLATAKSLTKICIELAPMFLPQSTPQSVVAFLNANLVKGQGRLAELAGLDAYQAESFVVTVQNAIEEAGREAEMSQQPSDDPAVEQGKQVSKLMGEMLEMMRATQSIQREHEAKIRELQEKVRSLEDRDIKPES
jgi:hypothetical protein